MKYNPGVNRTASKSLSVGANKKRPYLMRLRQPLRINRLNRMTVKSVSADCSGPSKRRARISSQSAPIRSSRAIAIVTDSGKSVPRSLAASAGPSRNIRPAFARLARSLKAGQSITGLVLISRSRSHIHASLCQRCRDPWTDKANRSSSVARAFTARPFNSTVDRFFQSSSAVTVEAKS